MATKLTVSSYLRRSITLAKRLEDIASPEAAKKKSLFVGFGFLVRNRRLAQAILGLADQHSYEKRILVRSMVEIHINYAWIRLKNQEFRASRFIKFEPIEQLRILEDIKHSGLMHPNDYCAKLREVKRKRAKVRHLFRHPNDKGKLRWDKTWASVITLESRMKEVIKSQTGNRDLFLYALYRWFSATIHGGPTSLCDVLEPKIPLRAKLQPEPKPLSHFSGAFAVLIATIEALAESSGMIEALQPELSKLKCALDKVKT